MATNGKTATSKTTKASSTASTTKTEGVKRSDAAQVREGATKARHGAVAYVKQTAERGVDVPVGAALTARDRIAEVIVPWTDAERREKELKSLRTQVARELNKYERRGGQARRQATRRVRQTRNRVERVLKTRRRNVERTVKENRAKAEEQLKRAQAVVQERVPLPS